MRKSSRLPKETQPANRAIILARRLPLDLTSVRPPVYSLLKRTKSELASSPILFDDTPRASLVGIARLASLGTSVGEGHEVEYFTLPARSILNRCSSPRMPLTWTINPYRACEFACKYCYARYTHEFMEMRDGLDFERKIYVKQNAGWLLRRDLKKVKRGEDILRDVELLREVAKSNQLFINLTVTTLNTGLARILEPRAPRPDLRIATVRKLSAAGLRVRVICAPVIPGITDAPGDLDALVRATVQAGGHYVYANPLFLKPCSEKIFMPFLEKQFPELVEKYRQRYGERAYLDAAYHKRISRLMAGLRRKHGIGARDEVSAAAALTRQPLTETQMDLF